MSSYNTKKSFVDFLEDVRMYNPAIKKNEIAYAEKTDVVRRGAYGVIKPGLRLVVNAPVPFGDPESYVWAFDTEEERQEEISELEKIGIALRELI